MSQKKEHENFIQKIDKIDLEHVYEDPEKFIEEILSLIFNWFLEHILLKDKLIKAE